MHWLMLFVLCYCISKCITAHMIELCQVKGLAKECQMYRASNYRAIKFPRHACVKTSCENCYQSWETRVLQGSIELVQPDYYKIVQSIGLNGSGTTFECTNTLGQDCECEKKLCAGASAYCLMPEISCDPHAVCTCNTRPARDITVAMVGNVAVNDPMLVSYRVCFFKYPETAERLVSGRTLLSEEKAMFEQEDVEITFNDPVFSFSHPGTLILRKSGQEAVVTVSEKPLQYVTPDALLMFPGSLKLLFVTPDGVTIQGSIQIEGRTVCRKLPCIFCSDLLYNLDCLPTWVVYAIYVILALLTVIVIVYTKTMIKAIWWVISGIYTGMKKIAALIRITSKFSMLSGLITGHKIRQTAHNLAQNIEQRALAMNNPRNQHLALAIIAVMVIFLPLVAADCNNHQVLHSEIRDCLDKGDTQTCKLWTQSQITLSNLESSQCLWFTDYEDQTLFQLQIRFKEARCNWPSERLYYTFPTTLRSVNLVSCPQNRHCGWTQHCNKPDLVFPTLTQESLDYSGITRCESVRSSGVCTLVHASACHFYRAYLIPDMSEVYEVRKITGYTCEYVLEIIESQNGTTEVLVVQDRVRTRQGIEVQILGTLDQPVELMQTKLIVKVADQNSAYLESASEVGRPLATLIGDVQANVSYTKQFIFDESMISCQFFDLEISCTKRDSYLSQMIQTKKQLLPLTQAFHTFSLDSRGILTSSMIHSAPLMIHLSFAGYNFSMETHAVCPRITAPIQKPIGCYACNTLAQLLISAYSTCRPGRVEVTFENVKIHTRSLRLTTEAKTYPIDFKTDEKCLKEKVCLVGKNLRVCEGIHFCLQEPTIRLNFPNVSTAYSHSGIFSDSAEWSSFFSTGWTQYLGNIFKYPLYLLVTLIILLFVISMVLSMCRR